MQFLQSKMRQNMSNGHTTLLCPDCRRSGFTKKNETGKNCAKCLQKRPTCAYLERSDRCNFCDASYLSCARCGDPLALASYDKDQRKYMRKLHRENKPIICSCCKDLKPLVCPGCKCKRKLDAFTSFHISMHKHYEARDFNCQVCEPSLPHSP